MDLAGSDRHGSAVDIDAATLPNWATSLISILGTSNGAMEEGLRRFESPVASHPAKQGKRMLATKHGNFTGALWWALPFETDATHFGGSVGVNLAGLDSHSAGIDVNPAALKRTT